MAAWNITTRAGSWVVTYSSPHLVKDCGSTPQEQANLDEVIAWLSDEADPGDLILYGEALVFQKLQPEVC